MFNSRLGKLEKCVTHLSENWRQILGSGKFCVLIHSTLLIWFVGLVVTICSVVYDSTLCMTYM